MEFLSQHLNHEFLLFQQLCCANATLSICLIHIFLKGILPRMTALFIFITSKRNGNTLMYFSDFYPHRLLQHSI
ncbi:hypothetical protein CW304_01130 [Bacillus sp. UFRGS-B20]|nr:hypothetical protein CW304_01130 [Bacillus sp. UFRGS-B20]